MIEARVIIWFVYNKIWFGNMEFDLEFIMIWYVISRNHNSWVIWTDRSQTQGSTTFADNH